MKTNKTTLRQKKSKQYVNLLFCILFFSVSSLFAQSKITIIRSDNVNKPVVTLTVNGKRFTANIGTTLDSGAKLLIPSKTTVLLKSPYGTQVCRAKDTPMEYIVEFKGSVEKHTIKGKGASIESTIIKGVGPNYRVTNRGTTTASKTTIFTFIDQSEGKKKGASVITSEGSVNIIDQVPVYVGGKPITTKRKGTALTKSISVPQSEGQGEYNADNNPVDYKNYQMAISNILAEISLRPDPDDRANNYLCLGELYLDIDEPQEAVIPFREAVTIYNDYYGDDDMSTLEAKLSLAEALMDVNFNSLEANTILDEVESILLEFLSWDMEDLKYEDDMEELELICEDITELNEFLGWLYDVADKEIKSDFYYKAADNGCF